MRIDRSSILEWLSTIGPKLRWMLGGGLTALALFLTNLGTISGAGKWVLAWFSAGSPPALLVRDLRPTKVVTGPVAAYNIAIAVEALVSNTGDQEAKNCGGNLVFPLTAKTQGPGGVAYGSPPNDVKSDAVPSGNISFSSGAAAAITSLSFTVFPSAFNKSATFRILCDNVVTDFTPISFPDPKYQDYSQGF
jgi:hypothetical protein